MAVITSIYMSTAPSAGNDFIRIVKQNANEVAKAMGYAMRLNPSTRGQF